MTSPAVAAFGVFILICTMALVIGAMYLGGGTEAIRRQIPQLALMGVVFVGLLFAVPFLRSTLGDSAWNLALLGLNAGVVVALFLRARRGQGSLAAEQRRAAFRTPRFRRLLVVWIVAVVVGTILLILAAKAGY